MSTLIATPIDATVQAPGWSESTPPSADTLRTIWGLSPAELHDRYWAARGIQVVRFGQRSRLVDGAELYLLMDPWPLTAFPPARLVDRLYWAGAAAVLVRLRDDRQTDYEERVLTDAGGKFSGLHRVYGAVESRFARVILTPDRALADAWQAAKDSRTAWQNARTMIPKSRRLVDRVRARVYDGRVYAEETAFVRRLAELWLRPDMTIGRATRAGEGIWRDPSSQLGHAVRSLGSAWIGAGRELPRDVTVVGPVVLWDLPRRRPPAEEVQWDELEPTTVWYQRAIRHARDRSRFNRALKRLFDIGFSLAALLASLPLAPIVMLLIWWEDGRPFFFSHARETRGGREFQCWKLRSMRKDAELIRGRLSDQNQADGPQFFIENDPRLTRVGRLIRKLNIDELPQFFNVLMGDMSVVGPRPSPRAENQFCPSWREARLSVRPGITGLWQIMRTRRPGMDFQEWIKYDLEYVERMSMRFDLAIIWQTIWLILGGKRKR